MRKNNKKTENKIAIVFIAVGVVVFIIEIIVKTSINSGIFDLKQRLALVFFEILILFIGFFALRSLLILYGLKVNLAKEKQSDLVFDETTNNDSDSIAYNYSIYFSGDNNKKDLLGRIIEDLIFQQSITFYSRELVNIMWELKERDDIILCNGQIKNIEDITALLSAYKEIMVSVNRSIKHIEYIRDGKTVRMIRVVGRTIEIRSVENECESLKSLFNSFGFEIAEN